MRTGINHIQAHGRAAFFLCCAAACGAEDWPQLQHDSRRSGCAPEAPALPLELLWTREFRQDLLAVYVQPILVKGKAVVGAKTGAVIALDCRDGAELWRADAGGTMVNTAASDGARIFTATLAGEVRAFNLETGRPEWRAQEARSGISASPLLMDGHLITGSRDGVLYCHAPETGELRWARPLFSGGAEAGIFQTPSGADGRVYATTIDMRLHCVEAETGGLLWSSAQVEGTYYKSFWPVVAHGKVVTTAIRYDDAVPYLHVHDAESGAETTPADLRAFACSACFHAPALDAAGNLVLAGGTGTFTAALYRFDERKLEPLPAPPAPFFELEPPLSCARNAIFATRPSTGPQAWHNHVFSFDSGQWSLMAREPETPEQAQELSCFPGAIADGRFVQALRHVVAAWGRSGSEKAD